MARTYFQLNRRYKHHLMRESGRFIMREVGEEVARETAMRARLRPYRELMGVGQSSNEEDGVTVHAGTGSSYAHWEEFGSSKWNGPIGPMRNAIRSMGFSKVDWDGPNSMKCRLD
jgi:hypothetical protein